MANAIDTVIVQDIARFLADYSSFTMRDDLFVGEIPRGTDGVYVIADPSPEPDKETGIIYQDVSFWSRYTNDATGFEKLGEIYNFFDRRHHYSTDQYYVHFSHAMGQIEDMDRDADKAKLLKLSVMFILNRDSNIS